MKILTATPLLLLGAALATIEGLPLESRRSSATEYQKWSDAIELAMNKTGTPGLSVAALYKGEMIFAKGFGNRNNKGEPVTPDVSVNPSSFFPLDLTASSNSSGLISTFFDSYR